MVSKACVIGVTKSHFIASSFWAHLFLLNECVGVISYDHFIRYTVSPPGLQLQEGAVVTPLVFSIRWRERHVRHVRTYIDLYANASVRNCRPKEKNK